MTEKNTKGRIRVRNPGMAPKFIKEKKPGSRRRLEKALVLCVPDHSKLTYLTKESCFIAIMMEDKYGIVAPYQCLHCHKWHMTSDKDTVRKYYRDRRQNRAKRI